MQVYTIVTHPLRDMPKFADFPDTPFARLDGLVERERQAREGRDEAAGHLRQSPEPPPLNAASLTERQGALRAARGQLGEYERQRQHRETLRGQLNTLRVGRESSKGVRGRQLFVMGLLGIAALLLIVATLLDFLGVFRFGEIVGLLLVLAAAVVLYLEDKKSSTALPSPIETDLSRQTADVETAEETARQSLLDSCAALDLDRLPDAAVLDSAEARLEAARNALDAWSAANPQIGNASRRGKSQEQRVETTGREHEAATETAREAQQEWRQWLGERRLDETLTADAMSTFIARVETARSSLSEAQRMRDRVAAIENDIREFRDQVEPLAARHDLPLDPNDQRQLARVADELIQRLDRAQTAVSQREQARAQEDEDLQLLESRERRLQSVEEELVALLAAGCAADTEEFRRLARQQEERVELERRRDEHRRSLERISGPGERFDTFCKELANADPDLIRDESALMTEYRAETDGRRNELREERGGIGTELAQLTSEEESSSLRIRRSTLEEQLRDHAREWSRLTVAEALLARTRQKFEQERQPSVVQHAQEFFSRVTGQRYNRLFAPIGEQTITVIDATGGSKQPTELSRGTREQLYLALRFGLIREFGEHAERLPVVVDEALVNFDPARARLAAEAFGQLAETNQVLVFTCHPATADMFAEAAGAQVVDLGD